ncbi:MAG: aldose 1-epimerase family protein [Planctomycetota bacterium]|nr:aldose 1-epimerase family protein [Planctomycetota bacterium]
MASPAKSILCWQLRQSVSADSFVGGEENRQPAVNIPEKLTAGTGRFEIRYQELESGRSAGLSCLTINTGSVTATILPDRGMGLWKCWSDDLEFGWQSPVSGPVHPSLVPIHDASGIGWLEGFDELLVRCGLQSNGAPEFSETGTLRYPLHGRIANLPASRLDIQVDIENGILDVVGVVTESRFLIYSLELQTRYRFRVGSPVIEIIDTVTNRSSQCGSMQLLYHINVGQPVLQSGSSVHAAYRSLAPRDERASESVDQWNQCDGPASGYREQVYFLDPVGDESSWSEAMLASADGTFGFAVHFDTRTLPYMTLWKNTASVEDGYVVGLEPGTGFPNPRSFEEKNGRVVALQGGESRTFRLKLQPLTSPNAVTQSRSRIEALQSFPGSKKAAPQPGQSSAAN